MKVVRLVSQTLFLGIFLFFVSQGKTLFWLTLFAVSLVATIFFGRLYCGYICPMGTLMRFSEFVSKKLHLQSDKVPRILKSKALPWIVLGMSVLSMIGSRKVLHKEIPILLLLLAISFVMTLRYKPYVFHNHVCPFGALLSIPGKISMKSVEVDQAGCIGCKKCEKVCDAKAIEVDKGTKKASVNKSMCHQCQACVAICPVKTIKYK